MSNMQPLRQPTKGRGSDHPVHKTLASASNLANLLPTGTVLAFQAVIPSFTNNGACHFPDKCLTASVIMVLAVICVFSSFTDSFTGHDDGKIYYGVATFRGLYVFNREAEDKEERGKLSRFKIRYIDYVHAMLSLVVFLVFALSNSDVRNCLFRSNGARTDDDLNQLMMHLPLAAGILASFLFTVFPTTRRGIGFSELVSRIQHGDGLAVTN